MTAFHLHLHACPTVGTPASTSALTSKPASASAPASAQDELQPRPAIEFNGRSLEAWSISQIERFSMRVSFEEVEQSMSQLPRMFFEMDGSFVWRGEYSQDSVTSSDSGPDVTSQAWQVDGMVYDVAGRVSRVELKGDCQVDQFQQLVDRLQPAESLVAFLIDQNCFVRVTELIRAWRS